MKNRCMYALLIAAMVLLAFSVPVTAQNIDAREYRLGLDIGTGRVIQRGSRNNRYFPPVRTYDVQRDRNDRNKGH